ncbi:MAG TPA: RNA polymerase sigma factor [Pseudomonadales bacterium]
MTQTPQPSRQALAALHDSAFRWALVCCGQREDWAREVMQMAYLEILTGRARFDGRSTLKTWLFAVVRNTARRHAARDRRLLTLKERLAGGAAWHVNGEATEENGDAAEAIGREQTRRAIAAALRTLSARQRQIVELVYYHELSLAEAAAVMNVGLGSARRHFHRAKRTLAAALVPVREVLNDD